MKIILVTMDRQLAAEARAAFERTDKLQIFEDWRKALERAKGADLMIVDLLATIESPHKIAGYEVFARAKMKHPAAKEVPLVLIGPPNNYDLDAMIGWPDFVFGMVRRPVSMKIFRRISTWV